LSVTGEQRKYVASIEYLFANPRTNWDYCVIEVGDAIVGFFNIDTQYWLEYSFANEGEYGLRSFFIDSRFQGQSYAKWAAVALAEWVFEQYPQCPSLCLTVNRKNPIAYRCYANAGFVDTENEYLGGKAGPQHIMRLTKPLG
jgi:RimJ/RimL family protein N-acetyltransferase